MKISDIEVTHLGSYGDDLTVANAARVSFHKEASNYPPEQNEKLINYLAKHKHFSPFNHAFLSFRVKAPIFVARQLVKHKFMPWNEVSRRYVDEEPEFYIPYEYRKKADNVKQGSSDVTMISPEIVVAYQGDSWYSNDTADDYGIVELSLKFYQECLNRGMCPEQARMFLPQNTMTEFVWSGTLGAFLDMLVLRLDPHTQKETRDVAEQIANVVQQLFPVSYNARITI